MGEGFDIGFAAANALGKGFADWKAIQRDRQERKEFDGAMGLASQRRAMIKSAAGVEEAQMLEQLKAQIQRSPSSEQAERPTGGVRDDGSPETEQVIRTPEGDIPIGQLMMLKQKKQQAETLSELAEVDMLMEMQARYPNNRYIKQWVASTYAAVQQKQEIRARQVEAQRLQLDTLKAGLQREEFEQKQREYREEPGREREKQTFETNERVRGDLAIAEGKARIEARNPKPPDAKGVMDLRKEYEGQAGKFKIIRESKDQIDSLAQQPASSANDLAILYSYIKLLDPDSVVREGEVQLSRSGSVPDQIVSEYKRLFTSEGSVLGPNVRKQIVENSGTVYGSRSKAQKALQDRYTGLAERGGIPAQDVVQDYLAPQSAPAAGAGDMVRVRAPDGRVGTIPRARLQEALSAGGQQVQ